MRYGEFSPMSLVFKIVISQHTKDRSFSTLSKINEGSTYCLLFHHVHYHIFNFSDAINHSVAGYFLIFHSFLYEKIRERYEKKIKIVTKYKRKFLLTALIAILEIVRLFC